MILTVAHCHGIDESFYGNFAGACMSKNHNQHTNTDAEASQFDRILRNLNEWKLELGLFLASMILLSQVIFTPGI
jgi:hypothetical protein